MARVTVEDCVLKIPNRFDLVMLSAQRARDISSGAGLTLDRDNDKNPVVALREIAEETVDIEGLAESLIQSMQKHVEVDEPEEDITEFDLPGLSAAAAEGEDIGLSDVGAEPEEGAGEDSEEDEPEEEDAEPKLADEADDDV